ncbi:DNA polymerase domain-containing protein, partial [Mycobacterium tuberculosis]|nr:DNA polymerase domain-containing protein [Mycobacterium tuberculosis]
MRPASHRVRSCLTSLICPGRVVFPAHNDRKGYTKFDLVRYYLAVAEGAMRGVAGRPMIL